MENKEPSSNNKEPLSENKKKEPSISTKIKEGVSIKEIESFARKYTAEVFLILAVFVAVVSSIFDFFTGSVMSLMFAGLGTILALAIPESITKIEKKIFSFTSRQERSAQIAIGIVKIVVALFVPFILFAHLGILSGLAFHYFSQMNTHDKKQK